jgi:hypothetical protein
VGARTVSLNDKTRVPSRNELTHKTMSSSRSGARIQRATGRDGDVVSSRAAPAQAIRTTALASPWILAPEREDDSLLFDLRRRARRNPLQRGTDARGNFDRRVGCPVDEHVHEEPLGTCARLAGAEHRNLVAHRPPPDVPRA